MDKIRQLGTYNNCQLFDINAAVRMHLRVTTLSDVVNAQGKHITEEIFKGARPTDRYSQLKWPRQPVSTTTKQRSLWKAALEAAFTSSGRTLQQPHGKWTGPPTQVWRSFYNPRTKRIITSTNMAYYKAATVSEAGRWPAEQLNWPGSQVAKQPGHSSACLSFLMYMSCIEFVDMFLFTHFDEPIH
jgi:hypothetical protein